MTQATWRPVRPAAAILACGLGLLGASPAAAQSELQLRQALEGQYVIVKMEMPATKLGIDVNPMKDPSIDFQAYSARIRQYGSRCARATASSSPPSA